MAGGKSSQPRITTSRPAKQPGSAAAYAVGDIGLAVGQWRGACVGTGVGVGPAVAGAPLGRPAVAVDGGVPLGPAEPFGGPAWVQAPRSTSSGSRAAARRLVRMS